MKELDLMEYSTDELARAAYDTGTEEVITDDSTGNHIITPTNVVTTNNTIDLNNDGYLTIPDPGWNWEGAWTIDFWWTPPSLTTTRSVWSQNSNQGNPKIRALVTSSDILYLSHFSVGTEENLFINNVSNYISAGTRVHMAFIQESSTSAKVYIDGVLRGSATWSSTSCNPSHVFEIGREDYETYNYCGGTIDRFRMVPGTALWTSNFALDDTSLKYDTNLGDLFIKGYQDGTVYSESTLRTQGIYSLKLVPTYDEVSYKDETGNNAVTATDVDLDEGQIDLDDDGYLTIPDPGWNWEGAWTIDFWWTPSSIANIQALWSQNSNQGEPKLRAYTNNSADELYLNHWGSTNESLIIPSISSYISVGTRVHLAFIQESATSAKIYINGVLRGSKTWSDSSCNPSHVFEIGREDYQTYSYCYGIIDRFRVVPGQALWTSGFNLNDVALKYNTTLGDLFIKGDTPPWKAIKTLNPERVKETGSLLIEAESGITDLNGNHSIVIHGNTTLSTVQKCPYNNSTKSIHLDGNGDYLTSPYSTDWEFGDGDFTIDLWAYITSQADHQVLFRLANDDTISSRITDGAVRAVWGSATTIYIAIYGAGYNNQISDQLSFTPQINDWFHFAFVRAGSSVKLFINGTEEDSGSVSGSVPTNTNRTLILGGDSGVPSYSMPGYLDNIRITKGKALWSSAFTLSDAALKYINAPKEQIDLSGQDVIKLEARSSVPGNVLDMTLTGVGATPTIKQIDISQADTWEEQVIDISGIADVDKNALSEIKFKAKDISPVPISQYDFDNDLTDSVGSNDGTLIGTAPVYNTDATRSRFITTHGGTNVSNGSNINTGFSPGSTFSMTLWIKTSASTTMAGTNTNSTGVSNGNHFSFYYDGSSKYRVVWSADVNDPAYYIDSGYVIPGAGTEWIFVAFSGYNTIVVWVGDVRYKYTGTVNVIHSTTLRLCAQGDSVRTYEGSMDEVRLYNSNLTDVEIDTIYGASTPEIFIDNMKAYSEANLSRPDNTSELYNIKSNNLRGKAAEGFIRPTITEFFTSEPFEEIEK